MVGQYTDLVIRIGAWQEERQAYPVEGLLADGSIFYGGVLRPDLAQLAACADDERVYGALLSSALFSGPTRRAFDVADGRARTDTAGQLRVRLWIDPGASELHALRWERMYFKRGDQVIPLAATTMIPFSRYMGLDLPEPPPLTNRPVRILVAVSNPAGLSRQLAPVDVDLEVENLHQALSEFRQAGRVAVSVMPGHSGLSPELTSALRADSYAILPGPTTLEALTAHLADHQVFFFIGHGAFRQGGDARGERTAALFLEDENGGANPAPDREIVAQLQALNPVPHLVFLVACQSGMRGITDQQPLVGLAPKLVQAGVPAVVAMQDAVSMGTARTLTRTFFQRLMQHGLVDRALNQARLQLISEKRLDWAIPVLFMRLRSGQLFAANPVEVALTAVRQQQDTAYPGGFLPLPIDVIHLNGEADISGLAFVRQDAAATQELVEAALNAYVNRAAPERAPFVVIVGSSGTAKTTMLRRIVLMSTLRPQEERPLLPLYVNLEAFGSARATQDSGLETLIFESLAELWPDLDAERFQSLLRGRENVTLRLLFDGSDDLTEDQRLRVWRQINDLVQRERQHEYLLATDPDNFQRWLLRPTDILVIQPLAERKVKQFLEERRDTQGRRLLRELQRRRLFDLAAIPWLMGRLLQLADQDDYPVSRTSVLERVVDEALADIPQRDGLRARAAASVEGLAWAMQLQRTSRLDIDAAYPLLAQVRGAREYGLGEMADALVASQLLTRVGEEALRFRYRPVQAYCAARAINALDNRDDAVDDITATLGRLSRLRWWEDTLVYLSGLLRRPKSLLQKIVYGVNLLESEQSLLAVRCMLEMRDQQVPDDLRAQVVDALRWRLNAANEPVNARRIRAIEALGQLRAPGTALDVAALANSKVRVDRRGAAEYEPSHVRLAAMQALARMMPEAAMQVRAGDPLLADVLQAWHGHDAARLIALVRAGEPAARVLAAFALADWQPPGALPCIVTAFHGEAQESQVSWGLAEALALFDPYLVTRQAILPLIDPHAAAAAELAPAVWARRATFYRVLVYLIGKIRTQDVATRQFVDDCLRGEHNLWLRGKAVEAIGWLVDANYRELFQALAVGDFSDLALPADVDPGERAYVQRKALEALSFIGDLQTLSVLRQGRSGWTPEMEQVYYQTSEEIFWRQNMSR